MSFSTGIAGASGYTGGELIRLLECHPEFEVVWMGANRAAGDEVMAHSPGLHALSGQSFDVLDVAEIPDLDLLFLALPAGEAASIVGDLDDRIGRIVDLGPDFRLDDPAVYARWYGGDSQSAADLAKWVYGLPEAARDQIGSAKRVANPGCYPTAALLALLPLLRCGLLGSGPIFIDGKSGLSGAGKSLSQHLHFPEAFGDVSPYALTGHRHLPEIAAGIRRYSEGEVSEDSNPVTFVPHLVPVARGLLDTCFIPLAEGVSATDVEAAYAESYIGETFVALVDEPPHTKAAQGSNMALLNATVDIAGGAAVVTCAIDNLVKGAAGQAIQNANLMFGLDEAAGLPKMAVWP